MSILIDWSISCNFNDADMCGYRTVDTGSDFTFLWLNRENKIDFGPLYGTENGSRSGILGKYIIIIVHIVSVIFLKHITMCLLFDIIYFLSLFIDNFLVTRGGAIDNLRTAIIHSPWTTIDASHCLKFYYSARAIEMGIITCTT